MQRPTRRRVLHGGGLVAGFALAGCFGDDPDPDDDPEPDPDDEPEPDPDDEPEPDPDDEPEPDDDPDPESSYEIWAADQGTDTIYIYDDTGTDSRFQLVDEIDTAADGGNVPHMVSFSSDYRYAVIACTAGARTLVYRTEDRSLVGNLETGPGSHFAGFTPDDEYIVVDVIGGEQIVRIDADLSNETFEIEASIDARENDEILAAGIESGSPVCHSYDHAGRSIHTFGPAYADGAVVIVDHDDFSVVRGIAGDELPANCGTMPHPTEDKFYLTAGLPSDPDAGVDGVGRYYVLDTQTDEVIASGETGGVDAHGFWFTTDGEELWVLNRESNNGVIIDPDTDEVVEEIDAFGPHQADDPAQSDSPDIMWASPDGEFMFVTLRGTQPVSGDPHAATGIEPGFAAIDVQSREIVETVVPDPDDSASDFHGIGVRPIADFGDALTSPPF